MTAAGRKKFVDGESAARKCGDAPQSPATPLKLSRFAAVYADSCRIQTEVAASCIEEKNQVQKFDNQLTSTKFNTIPNMPAIKY